MGSWPDLTWQPDIPAFCEQLAIQVYTGRVKEAITLQFTQEQVKKLEPKEVEKYYKRYETYVGSKTTKTLIEIFLLLAMRALGVVVKIKDAEALQNEIKNDLIITKELSAMAGGVALRCGQLLAMAKTALIIPKHIGFSADEQFSDQSPITTE